MFRLRSIQRYPLITNTVVALIYIVIAKWSLTFATVQANVTAIWPPTGFTIAMFLLLGKSVAPAVFLGAFVTNVTTEGSILTSLGIALGNTLEGLVGAFLVSRFAGGINAFKLPSWVFRFALFAGIVAPMVSATIGVASLYLGGYLILVDPFVVWLTWLLGDMGGAMIVTPLILLWYTDPSLTILVKRPKRIIFAMAILCAASFLVFANIFPYVYLTMPVLLFIAYSFSPRETISGVVVVAIIAIYATINRSGPFWDMSKNMNEALLALQIFLGILSMTKLMIAVSLSREREQEELVHETDRWYKTLIEKSTDAVTLIDADTRVLYTSPSTERVLGYAPSEFVGLTGITRVHPDDLTSVLKILAKVVATPSEPVRTEFRYQHKDGRWIWVQTTGRNLLHDPTIHAIVINYRDITEAKEFEQAKDDFIMIAAHQLRTPVSSIRWNAELLLRSKSKLPQAAAKGIQAILDSTHAMVGLIDELLEMSKIITGQVAYKPELLEVTKAIKNEIKMVLPIAKANRVRISFRPPPTAVPKMNIDERRFSRVMQNILSNAIKYSNPNGTIAVSIDMMNRDLVITVSDDGAGISKEDQQNLFKKFFRTEYARKRDPNGKGLGLYAVKQYMDSWGGRITVTSPRKDGSPGTDVDLYFPSAMQITNHSKKGVNP